MKKRFLKITSDGNSAFVAYDSGDQKVYNLDNISSIFLKFNKKSFYGSNLFFTILTIINIAILLKFSLLVSSLFMAMTILFISFTFYNYKRHSLVIRLSDHKSKTIKINDEFKFDTICTINKIKSKLKIVDKRPIYV